MATIWLDTVCSFLKHQVVLFPTENTFMLDFKSLGNLEAVRHTDFHSVDRVEVTPVPQCYL